MILWEELQYEMEGEEMNTNEKYFIAELARLRRERDELHLYKSEQERLKQELNRILHPNGDGPIGPVMCDLVSFVESDLKTLKSFQAENTFLREVVSAQARLLICYRLGGSPPEWVLDTLEKARELYGNLGNIIKENK